MVPSPRPRSLPALGFGVGLRPTHYEWILDQGPKVDWFEVTSETFLGVGGKPRTFLARVRERYPVALHGVGLGLGNAAPPPLRYLRQLAELAAWLAPRFVSDHLCPTGARGGSPHEQAPPAYTAATLAHVTARIDMVQDALGCRFYLENPAVPARAAGAMDEAEFLGELCRRTGCGLVLDLGNLGRNAAQLGADPAAYLARLNPHWICYMHLAAPSSAAAGRLATAPTRDGEPGAEAAWSLYELAARRFPAAATLVEWDDRRPEPAELWAHVEDARARHAAARTVGAQPRAAGAGGPKPSSTLHVRGERC